MDNKGSKEAEKAVTITYDGNGETISQASRWQAHVINFFAYFSEKIFIVYDNKFSVEHKALSSVFFARHNFGKFI